MFTGHPKGLFRLFFIEMWERLAFYTMVGVLMLYATDTNMGGLGLPEVQGNEIYGLYLAFVYFTPYIGGLLADRFLGYRRSVFIGGCFFALGFFLMGVYGEQTFYSGLVCLCIGNGFFKPNISVMVGNLYQPGDPKRDTGFNIFYMGINIGAFAANFLAAFMRNEWGWAWVFRAAGIGMIVGLIILLISWKSLAKADRQPEQGPDDVKFGAILRNIILPAIVFGIIGYKLGQQYIPDGSALKPSHIGFLIGMMPVVYFFIRLATKANEEEKPGLLALFPVYLCGATFFMVLHLNGSAMTAWARDNTDRKVTAPAKFQENAFPSYYSNAGEDKPRPNRLTLEVVSSEDIAAMAGQQRMSLEALQQVESETQGSIAVYTLTGTEGESVDSYEEAEWNRRGCDIYDSVTVKTTADAHGQKSITVKTGDGAEPVRRIVFLRQIEDRKVPVFLVTRPMYASLYDEYEEKYGHPPKELKPGSYMTIANSELFQSFNALFVILFTPLIIGFFTMRMNRGHGWSTAKKILAGMVFTTLSLLVMAGAGYVGDDGAQKVSWLWLVGFYAIITVGELCLSPMALSLVTKLSPKRFVGLTMGGWFLATAFGNNFSGFFGGLESQMEPTSFFLILAGIAGAVAIFIRILLPRLDAAIRKYGA